MTTELRLPAPLEAAPLISDWIRFHLDGTVEVLSGRVELGQGNLTALLQMAATELGLDPAGMTITGADTARTPNEGYTAGSMSVSQGGMSLRHAASAARTLILKEAGRRLNTDPASLTVRGGMIFQDGKASGLDPRDVAQDIRFDVPVAEFTQPLSADQRRDAGAEPARIDLEERVTGTPFVHDLSPVGLLHGRVVQPPAFGARLGEIDIAGLKARPGVIEVVRDGSFLGIVARSAVEAIAAENWAEARAEWIQPIQASQKAPRDIVRDFDGEAETVAERGDMAALTGRIVELTATRPFLSHGSIGPSAALATWQDGRLVIRSHSQGVFQLRAAIAQVLDMDAGHIDIAHAPGAGCYGHNGADDAALDAAILARAVPGRPVRVVWSRADEFRAAPLGPAMATTARATVDGQGRILVAEVTVNSAPHANRPASNGAPWLLSGTRLAKAIPFPRSRDVPMARGGGADRNAVPYYRIPNLRVTKRLVQGLPYRTSSLRALGAHANVFAIEMLMDRIAAETGQDPVALRLDHLDDPRARAVIEAVMQDGPNLLAETEGEGWGVGFARYKNAAAYAAVLARVIVDEGVTVTDIRAAVDMGEIVNRDGALNQIEGGILQATSWALKEEVTFDGTAVATQSWLDYPVLTFSEVPEVSVRLIDRPDAPPLGCAEAMQGPVAAAIGGAIFRAIGVQVCDMPFTRDRIISAVM